MSATLRASFRVCPNHRQLSRLAPSYLGPPPPFLRESASSCQATLIRWKPWPRKCCAVVLVERHLRGVRKVADRQVALSRVTFDQPRGYINGRSMLFTRIRRRSKGQNTCRNGIGI